MPSEQPDHDERRDVERQGRRSGGARPPLLHELAELRIDEHEAVVAHDRRSVRRREQAERRRHEQARAHLPRTLRVSRDALGEGERAPQRDERRAEHDGAVEVPPQREERQHPVDAA